MQNNRMLKNRNFFFIHQNQFSQQELKINSSVCFIINVYTILSLTYLILFKQKNKNDKNVNDDCNRKKNDKDVKKKHK